MILFILFIDETQTSIICYHMLHIVIIRKFLKTKNYSLPNQLGTSAIELSIVSIEAKKHSFDDAVSRDARAGERKRVRIVLFDTRWKTLKTRDHRIYEKRRSSDRKSGLIRVHAGLWSGFFLVLHRALNLRRNSKVRSFQVRALGRNLQVWFGLVRVGKLGL